MAKKRGSRYWATPEGQGVSHSIQLRKPQSTTKPRPGPIKNRYRRPKLGGSLGNALHRNQG